MGDQLRMGCSQHRSVAQFRRLNQLPDMGCCRLDGIDGAGLERAVWMLNSALVADLASRRWPEPGSAAGPGEPDRKI